MFKIALYELKRMLRDYRWLAIFLAQPIVVIILLGSVTIHAPEGIKLTIANLDRNSYSEQIVDSLKSEKKFQVSEVESEQSLRHKLENDESKSGVLINIKRQNDKTEGNIEVIENSSSPDISLQSNILIDQAIGGKLREFAISDATLQAKNDITNQVSASNQQLELQLAKIIPTDQFSALKQTLESPSLDTISFDLNQVKVTNSKNTNKDIKFFDFFASAVIVLLILIVGLNTSSTSITQERIDGTFERFFVTPYSKFQMIMGKMLSFSVVSIALSLLTIFSLKLIFAVTLGPIWLVLLITFLNALTAISLGVLISSLTYTIAESIQVSILCFFSSLILTGLIFQPETMNPFAQKLSVLIPFTYSVRAMREVNILNFGFNDVKFDLLILVGYVIAFLALAVLSLRRKAN